MKYSKNFFTFLVLIMVAAACAVEKEGQRLVSLEETFALVASDTVQLKDRNNVFWLSLQDVQDSRCPEDVNCITAGRATAALAVEQQPEEVVLCVGGDCSEEQNNFFLIEYNSERYSIVLEEILPYPHSGREPEKKRVILKIKRATG